jgi:hypothetical protein
MTPAEFALLLDADPKWVQNVAASLHRRLPPTVAVARRLAVARALTQALELPLPRAWELAALALRGYAGSDRPVTVAPAGPGIVTLTIEVHRILAGISARLSLLRTSYHPRQRGRPRAPRDPLRAAREYGVDLSLLRSNLRLSQADRLRQLDRMAAFRRRVRRV